MPAPDLSIIIPSVNSYDDLRSCLTALSAQQSAVLEVIVVDRIGDTVRKAVQCDFPDSLILPVAADTTIPAMRAIGIAAATAPAVAVIEDHVIVPPDWAPRMLDALAEGHDVVGGAIENAATETWIDWAAFLCEYSASLPPLPAGPSGGVPGNNVIYRKVVLDRYGDILAQHKWENHLHDAMKADGITLIMRPDIVVGHKMHYTFWLYFSQRFLYSRSYAGARVSGAPLPRRLAMGTAAFALPPLMFYRTVQRIMSKGKHIGHLVKSLPLLVPFCLSWGAGEVAGYWFGPGNALSKVR
ncbi:glycosyltransferase [Ruegeria meonggei]|uniref:Glycosyl transferase family 2 n=1 Tax=Ruegeria meonggei TaxID=1446476 RepID=A0A1X7AC92_9RHOB|nr:glycosyltransferase [Ruegeria meonggei]SLN75920.1 Glycosyl transferase family 2 [Ruegeria meonggei]